VGSGGLLGPLEISILMHRMYEFGLLFDVAWSGDIGGPKAHCWVWLRERFYAALTKLLWPVVRRCDFSRLRVRYKFLYYDDDYFYLFFNTLGSIDPEG